MNHASSSSLHDLNIRLLKVSDCDQIGDHFARQMADSGRAGARIFHPYEPDDLPDPVDMMKARRARYAKPLNEAGWGRAFGACSGAQIVAHVEIETPAIESGSHRGVLSIGIEIPYRGRALGKRLSNAALDWAQSETTLEWIDLHVFANNKPARALYQSLGFTQIGVTRDRFRVCGQRIDDIHMSLNLNDRAMSHE